jgi:hypothetical protein
MLWVARAFIRGWHTDRKMVVIESDDWGMIRMSSRAAYDRLAEDGYRVETSPYSLDALETDEDLQQLFEALEGVRDSAGRSACVTANMILANPDFVRIRESGFGQYSWEPVSAMLERDPQRRNVARLWNQGRSRGCFVPQLHGRDHYRWWEWLAALKSNCAETHQAFEMGMCGLPPGVSRKWLDFCRGVYMSDETLASEGVDLDQMITQGAELFQRQFGGPSLTTMAPNYRWTDHAERSFLRLGTHFLQGRYSHVRPARGEAGVRVPHFLGQRSKTGCTYLLRNCFFEPGIRRGDCVKSCLRQVSLAFLGRKPAVIESHRVNYVGSIRAENRENGIRQLTLLLRAIRSRWPDVEFLSTPEMARQLSHQP